MQIRFEPSRVGDLRRIFVVETDEIIRSALSFILHNENETYALTSLEQAYAKGRERRPDLVLLGLDIVRDEGVRVLGDMATRLPGVKILLVADSADEPLAHDCLDSGAHAVLGKPIASDSVLCTVDILLDCDDQPE
ncbi:response regulator [Pseudolabrys sp. FHR47]|uniref:response regulator n=1 Tax=Pseudolabrys sp. FHR47 TaxID=2562284 RepID=UPI00143D8BB0|nr:response regulator [Pseudolabrys sp. FHR47]